MCPRVLSYDPQINLAKTCYPIGFKVMNRHVINPHAEHIQRSSIMSKGEMHIHVMLKISQAMKPIKILKTEFAIIILAMIYTNLDL